MKIVKTMSIISSMGILAFMAACSDKTDKTMTPDPGNSTSAYRVEPPLTYSQDPSEQAQKERLLVGIMLEDEDVSLEAAMDEAKRRGVAVTQEQIDKKRTQQTGTKEKTSL